LPETDNAENNLMNLKKTTYNQYTIYTVEDATISAADPSALINRFLRASFLEKKGRGGIKLIDINGRHIACRKYIHGGLLRVITRDIFFSTKRVEEELEILLYLKERGFPVVQPCGLIVGEGFIARSLYILTVFEENAADLTEALKTSAQKQRFRIIKNLAQLMWHMETFGVYHPDLHLNNVLVTTWGTLKFLDFDRACRKSITKKDMERMFWRLNRYVEKMERQGKLKIHIKEKILFLRTYRKLSGFDMAEIMASKTGQKSLLSRIGWSFESLLYGRKGSGIRDQGSK
jgi:3-deoxy-D-manno-octulosonic acid kinase